VEEAVYFYWCAKCKTKDCKTWLVLKYIGRDDEKIDPSPSYTGPPLLVLCKVCGSSHSYNLKEMEPQTLAEPPSLFYDMF
jgi:hypothetical protein